MPTELQQISIDWRLLFEKMSIGFAVQKAVLNEERKMVDFVYLDVNHEYEILTGFLKETVLGKGVKELIPTLEDVWLERYDTVMKTDTPVAFENYVSALNKYYKVFAFKVSEDSFATIFEDVTSERLEKAEKEKEAILLNKMIDSINDFIFYKDDKGVYRICNESFSRRFAGVPKDHILGYNDKEIFQAKDPDKLNNILKNDREALSNDGGIRVEWVTRLADGSEAVLETLKSPFKGSKGDLLGIVGVSRDITERKEKEKIIAKKMSELEALNKLMVDRELKMISLKKEIEELRSNLGN